MDRNMNRSHWFNRQGGGGLKGGRPPRLTPPEPPHSHHSAHTHNHNNPHSPSSGGPPPPTTPPSHTTPHDDLINYIFESWDKISREAQVWEPPRNLPLQRPPLPPMDLDSWYGRRHLHNHTHSHSIKHNS